MTLDDVLLSVIQVGTEEMENVGQRRARCDVAVHEPFEIKRRRD